MRVAMVSEHASPLAVLGGADAGGQNVHVAALAAELARRGHTVEVYTRRDGPSLPARVRLGEFDVVHVPAGPARSVPKDELLPYMPEFGDWLGAQWRAGPPDVVHAHFWMSGVACLLARRMVRFPLALTFHALGVVKRRHQGAADPSPPERLGLERRLAESADAVIATATEEVRELLALGAPAENLHVVPCGVDAELFSSPGDPGRHDWWRATAGSRILSLGRLVERKGVATLIEALAAVPGAELVVAGGDGPDDPEVHRLRAVAESFGVADRVLLVGPVRREDVPDLIRSADVVACVPWYEPFGIVPLEAMACGRPVVTSAVGGMLDTVVDGVTGVHVPPRDPGRLAAALRSLLDDRRHRFALGRAGARRVADRYTWPSVAADTEHVYNLLSQRSAATAEPARREYR